jgi:hypothetical protein
VSGSLTWIDFSAADRERMNRAIALFQEADTVDELGVGTIRDAFADELFPGTSTIQTRLRYFLIVPWVYRGIERSKVPAAQARERARKAELALIDPLLEAEDNAGAFGKSAGQALKRLPSAVYWGGLQRWRILLPKMSADQYLRSLDEIRLKRRLAPVPDDDGVAADSSPTWHELLPDEPEGFPDELSFQLELHEAEYLRGRMESSGRSLLGWLARHGAPTSDLEFPWAHPDLARAPREYRDALDLARRFALLTEGAGCLYNLMLWKKREGEGKTEKQDEFKALMADWAARQAEPANASWSTAELWEHMDAIGARVPNGTGLFIDEWARLVAQLGPDALADHDDAQRLVRDREMALKGSRSRFTNPRALDQWGGSSGMRALTFRWPNAEWVLNDLYAGLGVERAATTAGSAP